MLSRCPQTACRKTGASVGEYTVAPCYMSLHERGAHEWIVEFDHLPEQPETPESFATALDEELRRVNSDYDAKRNSTMDRLLLHAVPSGTFERWMVRHGKNKVPRLSNDRRVLEEILNEME